MTENQYNHNVSSAQVDARDEQDARTWAMFCHLSGFAGAVIPFANIIVPFIIWWVYRDRWEFVNDQGKEALNWNISLTIYLIISALAILLVIGIFALIFLGLYSIIIIIVATVQASNGQRFRYPLTIRFIE